jgi:hypothetical protein
MTAVSDETGRDWLPLKYEDGLDFCTVTFATGAAFALTVHPERMKLMEAALSASPVETWKCAARKQSLPEPADCGWPTCGCDPYADKVIAALEEQGSASPVAQEPVARLCGYCKTWNSKPCGEQCYLQPSDPVWTSPPATPAGVGADEIARVFVRWKKSKNLHESLAAQNIEKELLALLSRAGDQK